MEIYQHQAQSSAPKLDMGDSGTKGGESILSLTTAVFILISFKIHMSSLMEFLNNPIDFQY